MSHMTLKFPEMNISWARDGSSFWAFFCASTASYRIRLMEQIQKSILYELLIFVRPAQFDDKPLFHQFPIPSPVCRCTPALFCTVFRMIASFCMPRYEMRFGGKHVDCEKVSVQSLSFDDATAYADVSTHGGITFPFRKGGLRNLLTECRLIRDADEFATSKPFKFAAQYRQVTHVCQLPKSVTSCLQTISKTLPFRTTLQKLVASLCRELWSQITCPSHSSSMLELSCRNKN